MSKEGNKCSLCGNTHTKVVTDCFPGFVQGTTFSVCFCPKCDTKFIPVDTIDRSIYNIIYSKNDMAGYDRYFAYAQEIKKQLIPLDYLASQEATYFIVPHFLKNEPLKKYRILEVGCGYGYLTWALNKENHDAIGIDLSDNAITYAKQHFGNFYYCKTVESLMNESHETFDVIVLTEVFEHINNPSEFIKNCLHLLKPCGHIILTTPNLHYASKKTIWYSDLPPIHVTLLSKGSINYLAKLHKLDVQFCNYFGYDQFFPWKRCTDNKQNHLFLLLQARLNSRSNDWVRSAINLQGDISNNADPTQANNHEPVNILQPNKNLLVRSIKSVVMNYVVRMICNFIYKRFFATNTFPILGVIFKKKSLLNG